MLKLNLDLMHREIVDELGQPVTNIALSQDGNCLLAGCLDSTLRLLDRLVANCSERLSDRHAPNRFMLWPRGSCLTGAQVNSSRNIKATSTRLIPLDEDRRILYDLVSPSGHSMLRLLL